MILKIGDYEVEVLARNLSIGEEDFNINSTEMFLNEISIACRECASKYYDDGYDGLGDAYKKRANNIFNHLDSRGVYNFVEESEKCKESR